MTVNFEKLLSLFVSTITVNEYSVVNNTYMHPLPMNISWVSQHWEIALLSILSNTQFCRFRQVFLRLCWFKLCAYDSFVKSVEESNMHTFREFGPSPADPRGWFCSFDIMVALRAIASHPCLSLWPIVIRPSTDCHDGSAIRYSKFIAPFDDDSSSILCNTVVSSWWGFWRIKIGSYDCL